MNKKVKDLKIVRNCSILGGGIFLLNCILAISIQNNLLAIVTGAGVIVNAMIFYKNNQEIKGMKESF